LTYAGKVVQYIGQDDEAHGYKHGYFYSYVLDAKLLTYVWKQVDVQPSSSGSQYVTVDVAQVDTLTPFAYNNVKVIMPNTPVKLTLPTPEAGKVNDLVIRLDTTIAVPSSFEVAVEEGCYLVRELLNDDVEIEVGNVYMFTYTYQQTASNDYDGTMVRATVASKKTTIAVDKTYVFYDDGT